MGCCPSGFSALKKTIKFWRVLENAHNKRNLAEYEGSYDVDEQTVEALIRVTITVAERVQELVI